MRRVLLQLNEECHTGLEKYELLSQLAATSVTLLYYVLIRHIADLAPVVYTPTVGEACQKFDRIYRLSIPRPTLCTCHILLQSRNDIFLSSCSRIVPAAA